MFDFNGHFSACCIQFDGSRLQDLLVVRMRSLDLLSCLAYSLALAPTICLLIADSCHPKKVRRGELFQEHLLNWAPQNANYYCTVDLFGIRSSIGKRVEYRRACTVNGLSTSVCVALCSAATRRKQHPVPLLLPSGVPGT